MRPQNRTAAGRARRRALPAALLAACGLALGLLSAAPDSRAADKSFAITDLEVVATLGTDGSMTVVEQVGYRFSGGPFTVGIRSFLPADRSRITGFTAREQGDRLLTTAPGDSISHEWEWEFARPATDEDRTFELAYSVPRAVVIGSDVGELYWQFLGKDHPGVGRVRITIDLPGSFDAAQPGTPGDDATVVRAWGHGPRSGVVDVTGDRVTLAVDDVPAGRFVEARLAIPAEAFSGDRAGGPRLAAILDEEGADIDRTLAEDAGRGLRPAKRTAALGRLLTVLSGAVGAIGLWIVGRRQGREPTPDGLIGEYWREPLDDPPAVALANLAKGSVQLGNTIAATMVDLAQRGYIRIEERHEERFGPDRREFVLHRTDQPLDGQTDPLRGFERLAITTLFGTKTSITNDDIDAWATADPARAKAFAASLTAAVKREFDDRHYVATRTGAGMKAVALLAGAVALLGVVSLLLGTRLGWVAIGVAAAVLVGGAIVVRNRTQAGADAAAKATGLKKYIEDFSQLADAPVGHLVLWERFLVFAVAFGVADKLLDGLQTRLPALLADPRFGMWYVGPAGPGRLRPIDRFPASFGGHTAAVVAPSKSGSGGGFSSGGGGGGGGGGFGAR